MNLDITMSISRRQKNKENQSYDDERYIDEDYKPKFRMLELYIVNQNRKLEKLISDYDDNSTIDLSCQKLTDRDMAIILKYGVLGKRCRILNLWGNQFTYESLSIFANILNGNQTLKELDFSYNRLSDRGVEIISEVLSLNTCVLKEIDLSSNGITDRGAKYLSHMLRKNKKLKFLILNKNEITNNGLISLADALHDNQSLKQLKIESNPQITRNGIIDILNLLKHNQTLEDVYVKNCDISNKDFRTLEQMAFTTGFDIIV